MGDLKVLVMKKKNDCCDVVIWVNWSMKIVIRE